MNRICAFLFALFFCQSLAAQNTEVVMEIDGQPILKGEFETIYKKNNRDSAITRADLDEYAELFANFKLKVMQAEALGMDTAAGFQRELQGYRDQLARPYLVDKSVTDSLVHEAYDRLGTEVRASHILIKLPANPGPADTLKAYKQAMALKKQLVANPDEFAAFAKKHSDDPGAKSTGGDLGWFTALQMVYPFETAVYQTPVGEIAGPVRTRFGYHLIKVTDKRKAHGQVQVAHIMIRSEEGDPEEVQDRAEQRIREVYQKLQAGEDFGELAQRYSDDRASTAKGGELPPFGTGKMVAEFEDAAFALDTPGAYSEPIQTPYGWHIIKLIKKIPLEDFDTMEKELRSRIERDSRAELSKDMFIDRLKKEYDFEAYPKALEPFRKSLDTSYFHNAWEAPAKLADSDKPVFTLAGEERTQADFTEYLLSRMRPNHPKVPIETVVDDAFEHFVNASIMEYENSRLEQKYPEFRALMKEYRDGILLFDLTDKKVWSKAVEDSAGLHAFYMENQDQFMWDERAGYDIYTVDNEKDAKAVVKMLKKGKNQDDVREALSEESALGVRIESGMKEKDEEPLLAKTDWKAGVYGPFDQDGRWTVVHIKEIREAEPKAFDEARGLITAAYQNYLEQQWVDSLRADHDIVIHKDVLYSIK